MNAYIDGMRRYFSFSGRSTRSQYWLFALGVIFLAVVGIVLDAAVLNEPRPAAFTGLVYLMHMIPSLALTVRRLHDANKTGWLVLLLIIPLVNLAAYVAFGCMGSTPGVNRFGSPVGVTPPQHPVASRTVQEFDRGASTVERLEKLAALRASGAIDQLEFERLKAGALTSGT